MPKPFRTINARSVSTKDWASWDSGSKRGCTKLATSEGASRTGSATSWSAGRLRTENSSTSAMPAPIWTREQAFCGEPTSMVELSDSSARSYMPSTMWPKGVCGS